MDVEDDDAGVPTAVEYSYPERSFESESENRRPVGITVITGYLGSGKSTLVNYVLNAKHGKKIAVILNEFGEEIGVERAMINEGDEGALIEEWVELANGCVCCTVKHSLVQALEQLVQRKDRLDHILLETTGLANPAPLASILWLDEQLESAVILDAIITVVDARNIFKQLSEYKESSTFSEAFQQIVFADVIIVNKIDLVSSSDSGFLENLEKEIKAINSLATIIHSDHCQVDLAVILDKNAYNAVNTEHVVHFEKLLEDSKSSSANQGCHNKNVRTVCLCKDQQVDVNMVRLWLEDILWEKQGDMDVYRCKGILNVLNSDKLHTLQAVREIYDIVPTREWNKDENRTNKIVFIGHNLDEKILNDTFSTFNCQTKINEA
ncbi:Cobalamin synthesis protein P47K [Zostera marina]|uniref:Cobalamin synthesis protein P47K n=1 Tax=Zostera marina TaxID=29655 RepID=A0A0K9PCR9_ZOSMR|nr:Cobalamin synthesis protein P47K [Zostera marina]